jgi:succinate-semialdehyde dehydrogenase/glutarate-semialdehyde dehydrogenase
LELGGKDAVIVDRDVDITAVAQKVVRASFENAGQICTSAERVLVHQDIHGRFVNALRDAALAWSVGRHDAEDRQIGPLIDAHQREIVQSLVTDAVSGGARVVAGGHAVRTEEGAYFEPTVIDGVNPRMSMFTAELFGPVVAVTAVRDMPEAVELANSSSYGLAATVFSNDSDVITWASRINTAIVWQGSWHASVVGSTFEPDGDSGMGASGPGLATLQAVSRPMLIGGPYLDV